MSDSQPFAIPFVKRRLGVGAGFVALLALMLLLTGLGVTYMDTTEERATTIVNNHMAKIELATRMHHAARERTVNLQKMILFTDPFERDEQWLQFNNRAGEFAATRGQLLALPLTPEERELLDRQGRLTGVAVPLQDRVVELSSQGRIREAQRLLVEQAIPAQDAVLEQLVQLYTLQKREADRAVGQARRAHQRRRAACCWCFLVPDRRAGRHHRRHRAAARPGADAALHRERTRAGDATVHGRRRHQHRRHRARGISEPGGRTADRLDHGGGPQSAAFRDFQNRT